MAQKATVAGIGATFFLMLRGPLRISYAPRSLIESTARLQDSTVVSDFLPMESLELAFGNYYIYIISHPKAVGKMKMSLFSIGEIH